MNSNNIMQKYTLSCVFILLMSLSLFLMGCTLQVPQDLDLSNNTNNETQIEMFVPVSDEIFLTIIQSEDAKENLENGKIDYYLSPLNSDDVHEIKSDSETNITLYPAVSTVMGFYVNPAPAYVGLNPFSSQKVRFALNFLIDRERIVQEVYGGEATPMIINPWPGHPSYNSVSSVVESYNITYDKEKGMELLNEGMTELGANKINDTWYYNDTEIILILPVYNGSDASKDITEMIYLVGEDLTNIGFIVEYPTFEVSNNLPQYVSDPQEMEWNVAISGGIYYGASKYQETSFLSAYYEDEFWSYENKNITEVEELINLASTHEEWDEANAELARLYIEDSMGLWLVALDSNFGARKEVEGIVDNNFVGIRSYNTIRQANVSGKNSLSIGTPYLYDEGDSWNPVIVENIHMMDLLNAIHDPTREADSKTLEEKPFRWNFEIERFSEPSSIPNDVFNWNATEKKWQLVSENVTAMTKVTYDLSKYVGVNWHHGEEISWADVLYFIASSSERAYDVDKQKIAPGGYEHVLNDVIGYKINGNNLETYLSIEKVDDSNLLGVAGMFQRIAPFEIYAANDKLVYQEQKYLYYYKYNSNLSSLSLVNPEHVSDVLNVMSNLTEEEIAHMVTINGLNYLEEGMLESRVKANYK